MSNYNLGQAQMFVTPAYYSKQAWLMLHLAKRHRRPQDSKHLSDGASRCRGSGNTEAALYRVLI
jgi:hypothetical protein